MLSSVRVAQFAPSSNGFAFASDSVPAPDVPIVLPDGTSFLLSDIVATLSGGMTYAVADYFRQGNAVPTGPPSDALLAYLVQREVDSLDVNGIYSVVQVMHPNVTEQQRTSYLLAAQWARVQGDLDSGFLSQLACVSTITFDIRRLGEGFSQVLAFGYDFDDATGRVTLLVYDPAYPGDNTVFLTFETLASDGIHLAHSAGTSVLAFFRSLYALKPPP